MSYWAAAVLLADAEQAAGVAAGERDLEAVGCAVGNVLVRIPSHSQVCVEQGREEGLGMVRFQPSDAPGEERVAPGVSVTEQMHTALPEDVPQLVEECRVVPPGRTSLEELLPEGVHRAAIRSAGGYLAVLVFIFSPSLSQV